MEISLIDASDNEMESKIYINLATIAPIQNGGSIYISVSSPGTGRIVGLQDFSYIKISSATTYNELE